MELCMSWWGGGGGRPETVRNLIRTGLDTASFLLCFHWLGSLDRAVNCPPRLRESLALHSVSSHSLLLSSSPFSVSLSLSICLYMYFDIRSSFHEGRVGAVRLARPPA